MALSVEYCMACSYLSPIVMDAAAAHLVENGESYHPLQLYAIVRAYGYLNYLPVKPTAFLKKVRMILNYVTKYHFLILIGKDMRQRDFRIILRVLQIFHEKSCHEEKRLKCFNVITQGKR